MGEKFDDAKGKAKQVAGDLTGDKDLQREGKVDRAGASVKKKASDAVDTVKEKVGKLTREDDR